ncbi:hypothetical protein [Paraburkholderia hospita]|uniref:hypothetical protein n=1 Tax=Paraburkholderia hospita TaxID=169430 RepID=UPI0005871781|nr:hypothetical protein [Paraburkholderia hospita]OUL88413.1 hypothetical protein CA602_11160 [Paraburkholderia hospita]
MENVRVNFVPASTRATLAHLGIPFRTKLDGQTVQLPTAEMLGEAEWRVDVLRWLVRRVFFRLVSSSRPDRKQELTVVEKELTTDFGLHPLEAKAVVDSASLSRNRLSGEEVNRLNRGRRLFEGQLEAEWNELANRYWEIVREEVVENREGV